MKLQTLAFSARALVLASCLSACVVTDSSAKSDSKWLEPSPTLREEIEEHVERLPYTHNSERVELIKWFAEIGEPAYPWLLELLGDERQSVSSAAMSALGSTKDPRLVSELREVPWPSYQENLPQALERARALMRLGDWEEMPVLIMGLESERLWTRALCASTLYEATNDLHGYDPRAEPEERAVAVAEWKAWWNARSNDPLLEASSPR